MPHLRRPDFQGARQRTLRPDTHDYAEQPLHEAILAAQKSDVVILCTGLRPDVEGEQGDAFNSDLGGDRRDIELPEAQLALFNALAAVGKPIVVVNTSGSAVSFATLEQRAAAILQVWYPGQSGGTAVADILFGHASPSGKLPVTFYRSIADLPAFHDYAMTGRTYRYMTRAPLYPFGFGLTYGRICLDSASPSALNVSEGEPAQIQVIVSNRKTAGDGNRPGVSAPTSARCRRHPAAGRVQQGDGASRRVGDGRLTIRPDRFRCYQDDGNDVFEPGRATLLAGCSLPIARSTELGAPPWLCIPVRLDG
jgi:beta-glucosidase